MQQFIPFEDNWDALAHLRLEDMVPYRVGMMRITQREDPIAHVVPSASLICEASPVESPAS